VRSRLDSQVIINGRTHTVSVERTGRVFRVAVDDRQHVVDAALVDSSTLSLLVDQRSSVNVSIAESRDSEVTAYVNGTAVPARIVGVRGTRSGVRPVTDKQMGVGGPQKVLSPMPGKVVRLLTKVGDCVKARQPLVVVEAMKMENELRSPKDGQVKDISAVEGMSVDAGAVLVVIE
jgi:biotin carboxyl carrier protein